MSAEDLRKAMLNLMAVLREEIRCTEVDADRYGVASADMPDQPVSQVLRSIAIRHRVRLLELRSRLAAARSDYVILFGAEP